jgi:hypothetical protein
MLITALNGDCLDILSKVKILFIGGSKRILQDLAANDLFHILEGKFEVIFHSFCQRP